ncbi:streptophobe family protein [Streptomyces sp. NPDC053367]|uniref:streptophobe family protein n=1 Tax=Streptomyces sp. NPDC053367 TaxID=3365700 RepID=UPI0037CFE2F8
MRTGTVRTGGKVPWIDVLSAAIASVSWALIGMATTAGLGLHLLDADARGELGPMTAAVVALGAGGSVTTSGDVSVFGLEDGGTPAAVEITPLGVGLVGALLLSWFFLRSLRAAGVVVSPAELLVRAGSVVGLFVAMLGGLAWVGHDVITIDGPSGGVGVPGLEDVGGWLPDGVGDRVGDLIDAKVTAGFTVDTAPTLLGGACWAVAVLLIALSASRGTPLPGRPAALHRVVRPCVSALVTVLLVAVAAGWAAAGWAALGDDHPRRIAGAALLGAPNGVWLGLPIGLFVPFDGDATGIVTRFLPDPLDGLLVASDRPVTLPRLAELDVRVWLLGVAAAAGMLLVGVLAAVRTPLPAGADDDGPLRFAGACALRLGVTTAVALPFLTWLVEVSVNTSPPALGVDLLGTGVRLEGRLPVALPLGAAWGAGAGALGALLARACRVAGRGAAWRAPGDVRGGEGRSAYAGGPPGAPDPYSPGPPYRATYAGAPGASRAACAAEPGAPDPYDPGTPGRAPDPATNPCLRTVEDHRPDGAAGDEAGPVAEDDRGRSAAWGIGVGPGAGGADDFHGAPTVVRPSEPGPRGPGHRPPGGRSAERPATSPEEGPPPPPGPPPPRPPRGRG